VKLQTGDNSFFPTPFKAESGAGFEIVPISMNKDYELRRRVDAALERGPGMAMVLGGPDLFKVLAVSSTEVAEDLIDICAFIFEVKPEQCEALTLPEIIEVIVCCLYHPTEASDEERVASGNVWTLARVIDFFGKEYGWTIPETLAMSRHQLKTVLNAVESRYDEEKKAYDKANRKGGLSGAGDRMSNTNLLNEVSGEAQHRKPMKKGADGKPEPDWETSTGSNSLLMFANTLGIPIKVEGDG
jgi:hypothetical protein